MATLLQILTFSVVVNSVVHAGAFLKQPCEELQYIEFGKTEILQCSFKDFFSVIWYNSTDHINDEPLIFYTQSVKGGPGYVSGQFDIDKSGSLVIRNVSLRDDHNFTVGKLDSSTDSFQPLHIQAIVIVKPRHVFPIIDNCNQETNFCFREGNLSSILTCSVHDTLPVITLRWYRRSSRYDVLLTENQNIVRRGILYTTNVSLTNIWQNRMILDLIVCKALSKVPLLQQSEHLMLVQNADLNFTSIQPKKMLVLNHSRLILPCSEYNVISFIWKRMKPFNNLLENILYGTFARDKLVTSFNDDYTLDSTGSLIIENIKTAHGGIYICIWGNSDLEDVRMYDVKVYSPSDTEPPVIEDCRTVNGYCVLPVGKEGNLTCMITGIGTPIKPEWNVVSESSNRLIEFVEETRDVSVTGDTYTVSLTSNFFVHSELDRLTIECRNTETTWHLLNLTTKIDLVFSEEQTVIGFKAWWIFVSSGIAVILLIAVCIALALRKVHKKTNKGPESGQGVAHKKREKAQESVKDDYELNPMIMHRPTPSTIITEKEKVFAEELSHTYRSFHTTRYSIHCLWDEKSPKTHVFVEPIVIRFGSNLDWITLGSYKQVLHFPNKCSLIMLEGESGYGKSTLIVQLALDWASWKNESEFKKIDLLICLQIKQFLSEETIYKAIKQFLLPKNSSLSIDDVKTIMHSASSVVIILDCDDNYHFNLSGDVLTMVKALSLTFKVVLATNPSFVISEKDGLIVDRIKVMGFDEKCQDRYMKQMFKTSDKEAVVKFPYHFRGNHLMKDIGQSPMFFAMFAHMTNAEVFEFTVDSLTTFFKSVITYIHKYNTYRDDTGSNPKLTGLKADNGELCKLAFDNVRTSSKARCWKKTELYDLIGETLSDYYIRIGILDEEEFPHLSDDVIDMAGSSALPQSWVTFRHNIFCEWYAAHYIVEHTKTADYQFVTSVLENVDSSRFKSVYQFACGLNQSLAGKVIRYLNETDHENKLVYLCLLEQRDQFDIFTSILRSICSKEITFKRDDSRLVHRSAKKILDEASLRKIVVNSLHFDGCIHYSALESGSIRLISNVTLGKLTSFETIEITKRHRPLTAQEMRHILNYVSSSNELKYIRFNSCGTPADFKNDNLITSFREKNVEVIWKAIDGLKMVYHLNLKTRKWKVRSEGYNILCNEICSHLTLPERLEVLKYFVKDEKSLQNTEVQKNETFIGILEKKEIMSAEDIVPLLECFKGLKMQNLVDLVENYQKGSSSDNSEKCVEHKGQTQMYFCFTCDVKLCATCYFRVHKGNPQCDVIELEAMPAELISRERGLQKESQLIEELIENVQELSSNVQQVLSQPSEILWNQISTDETITKENIARNRLKYLEKIKQNEENEYRKFQYLNKKTDFFAREIKALKKIVSDPSVNLIQIKRSRQKLEETEKQLEHHRLRLQRSECSLLYRTFPNDGSFGILQVPLIVGGVAISKEKLVQVFDDRQISGGVVLVCVDPYNSSKEYWRCEIPTNDHSSPVVISHISMFHNQREHVLFAVGNIVFFVNSTGSTNSCKFSKKLNDINEGSWISSISAYYGKKAPQDSFLISLSESSVIKQYRLSGIAAVSEIETRNWVPSIDSIAHFDIHLIAIISLKDILLFRAANELKYCKPFQLISDEKDMIPVCAIFSGVYWLVLYFSGGSEKIWKIVDYPITGTHPRVLTESIFSNEIDIPVSITRWQDNCFVTFANGNIKGFSTRKNIDPFGLDSFGTGLF